MSSEETPRGLIQGFLLTNEINQSTVNPGSGRRRSSRQISLHKLNNDSKRSDEIASSHNDVDINQVQANTRRRSLNAGKFPSNRWTQSTPKHTTSKRTTPKHTTPDVSARIAARNLFLRSKRPTEDLQSASKRLQMAENGLDDPTPRDLIRGFLNNADPQTPAVHRLESPPTENFMLPGIYNDEVMSVHKNRPMSPLVDAEVSVGSSSRRSASKRKRKRQELTYDDFFSGIEKRMKTAGPRIEEEAAAELENDTSTLEERAETEAILSSSPDTSGTQHSRIHLQSGTNIPDFQIGDVEDYESVSGDESLDGNIQDTAEENNSAMINDDNDGEEVKLPADEPDKAIGSDKLKGSHTEVAPRLHIGEDKYLSEDQLPEAATDSMSQGEDISRDSESEEDVPEEEPEDGSFAEERETQQNPEAARDGRSQGEDSSRDSESEDQDVAEEEQADGSSVEERATQQTTFQPSNIESRGFTDIDTNLEGQTLYDNDFQKLKTPHISPRGYKTPVLTERKQRQRVQVSKTVPAIHKTTRKARSPRKKSQPPLPTSLTKSIFGHFSAAKVSKEAIAAVERGSEQFFKRLTADLGAYCKHSHRQTIEMSDVELLMKRQKLITSKQSLESLIEQHLTLEYRRELIPVAYAGNVVKPKM